MSHRLVGVDGPLGSVEYVIEDECLLGRSSECAVRITAPEISRYHARIVSRSDGTLVIEDLQSRSGVYVNGERVSRTTLRSGDLLRVGSQSFRLQALRRPAPHAGGLVDVQTTMYEPSAADAALTVSEPASALPALRAREQSLQPSPPAGTPIPKDSALSLNAQSLRLRKRIWRRCIRRWWVVLGAWSVLSVATVFVARTFQPRYQASALLQMRQPTEAAVGNSNSAVDNAIDPTELARRLGNAIDETLMQKWLLSDRHLAAPRNAEKIGQGGPALRGLVSWLVANTQLVFQGDGLYKIKARAMSAALAQSLTQRLAEYTLERYRELVQQKATLLATFTARQAKSVSSQIAELEQEMVVFLAQHPQLALSGDKQARQLFLADEDRLRAATASGVLARLAAKDPRLASLLRDRGALRQELKRFVNHGGGVAASLRRRIDELRAEIDRLRTEGKTDLHPLMRSRLRLLNAVKKQLTAAAGDVTASDRYESRLRGKIRLLNQQIRTLAAQVSTAVGQSTKSSDTAADAEAKWSQIRHRHRHLSEDYSRLREAAANAQMKRNLLAFEVQRGATIVEPPKLPTAPIGLSRKMLIAGGSALSLLTAVLGVLLLAVFDRRIYAADEMVWALRREIVSTSAIPTAPARLAKGARPAVGLDWSYDANAVHLGDGVSTVSVIDANDSQGLFAVHLLRQTPRPSAQLYVKYDASGEATRQIRLLALRLHAELQQRNATPLVGVIGDSPGVGATTIAANLALALSESDTDVLLVDGDGSPTGLSRAFQVPAGCCPPLDQQLVENLTRQRPGWAALKLTPQIRLVPAQPSQMPITSLLSSAAFARLIDQASSRYKLVVVDMAPPSVRPDIEAIGDLLDIVIVVSRRLKTRDYQLDALTERLAQQATVHAVVNCSEG